VLATADSSKLNEMLSNLELPQGSYRLVVSGTPVLAGANGLGDAIGSYSVKALVVKPSASSYQAEVGKTATLTAPDGPDGLQYKWDLDNDGNFGETGTYARYGNELGRTVTFTSGSLGAGTVRTVHLRVSDGLLTSYATATVTVVAPPPPNPAPSTWTLANIGSVGIAGSVTASASDALTIKAAGANISGTSDSFSLVSRSFTGDGQIVARVDSLSAGDGFAKAGVMMRAGSAANATNAYVYVTPANGVVFATRESTGADTLGWKRLAGAGAGLAQARPARDTFSGFMSTDGSNWQQLGVSRTYDMGDTGTLAGLAVTSKNTSALATAKFSGVAFGAVGPLSPVHPLTTTADAYVRDGAYAGTNFGNDAQIMAKTSASGYNRQSFLRFDLSNESNVNKTILRLYGSTDASTVRVGVVGATSSTWSETAITWNNRPGTTGTPVTVTVNTTKQWYEWDVTALVKSQLAAGKTSVALAIKGIDSTAAFARVLVGRDEQRAATRGVVGFGPQRTQSALYRGLRHIATTCRKSLRLCFSSPCPTCSLVVQSRIPRVAIARWRASNIPP
jgi:hypothetical protein